MTATSPVLAQRVARTQRVSRTHRIVRWAVAATVALVVATAPPVTSPSAAASAADPPPTCHDYASCYAIGMLAYTYAYPLVMTGVTEGVGTNVPNATTTPGRAPVNQFSNNALPTPGPTDIVLPNVNTPYSVAWLDLREEPVVMHLPDLGGRFFLMESMDAWTNVIPNSPGTRTAATAGDYAYVGPDWTGPLPAGLTQVFRFPTNTVFIAGRTYSTGSAADLAAVTALQSQYTLTPLHAYGTPYSPPARSGYDPHLDTTAPYTQIDTMDAVSYFARFAQLWQSNPPLPGDAAAVDALARVGLVPGKPFDIDQLDPVARQALTDAAREGNKIVDAAAKRTSPTVTNWNMTLDLGAYGSRYLLRAATARGGYGANYFRDAVYAGALEDGTGQALGGAHRYTLHFAKDELPPADPRAFWSVTLYNVPGETLFPNSTNRNALGIPAVQDHLPCFDADGSLTFYIQAAQPDPTTEATKYCNWLPAPEGTFVLLLRMYWPTQKLFDGKWIPPAVQQAP
ncbi:DUF1254 domain-containing protein [Rhodococcus sp. NPDC127528]|uniref:DUF1254 domain-containing protein n=1 Tax=unclassified Rhodococcus (in: high G+C Gram-positive bacteria) TaxID=192944 RepID=UPI003626D592